MKRKLVRILAFAIMRLEGWQPCRLHDGTKGFEKMEMRSIGGKSINWQLRGSMQTLFRIAGKPLDI